MDKHTLEKVDNTISELCDLSCKRFNGINTDKAIALAEAIGKLLAARAALAKGQPNVALDSSSTERSFLTASL